jgi:hypothetical protein
MTNNSTANIVQLIAYFDRAVVRFCQVQVLRSGRTSKNAAPYRETISSTTDVDRHNRPYGRHKTKRFSRLALLRKDLEKFMHGWLVIETDSVKTYELSVYILVVRMKTLKIWFVIIFLTRRIRIQ